MINDIDKRRRTNYNFYTEQKWGMAENYTMSLNSSVLGYDLCQEMISLYKKTKLWYDPIFDSWKDKNGYKPSKHGLCSRFLFRNDMCYIMIFLI